MFLIIMQRKSEDDPPKGPPSGKKAPANPMTWAPPGERAAAWDKQEEEQIVKAGRKLLGAQQPAAAGSASGLRSAAQVASGSTSSNEPPSKAKANLAGAPKAKTGGPARAVLMKPKAKAPEPIAPASGVTKAGKVGQRPLAGPPLPNHPQMTTVRKKMTAEQILAYDTAPIPEMDDSDTLPAEWMYPQALGDNVENKLTEQARCVICLLEGPFYELIRHFCPGRPTLQHLEKRGGGLPTSWAQVELICAWCGHVDLLRPQQGHICLDEKIKLPDSWLNCQAAWEAGFTSGKQNLPLLNRCKGWMFKMRQMQPFYQWRCKTLRPTSEEIHQSIEDKIPSESPSCPPYSWMVPHDVQIPGSDKIIQKSWMRCSLCQLVAPRWILEKHFCPGRIQITGENELNTWAAAIFTCQACGEQAKIRELLLHACPGGDLVSGTLLPAPHVALLAGRHASALPRAWSQGLNLLDDFLAANGFSLILCAGTLGGLAGGGTPELMEAMTFFQGLKAAAVVVVPLGGDHPAKQQNRTAGDMLWGYTTTESYEGPEGHGSSGKMMATVLCIDTLGPWTRWVDKNHLQGRLLLVRPDKYIFGIFDSVVGAKRDLEKALLQGGNLLADGARGAPKATEL